MREEARKTLLPDGLSNGLRTGRLCYQVTASELSLPLRVREASELCSALGLHSVF